MINHSRLALLLVTFVLAAVMHTAALARTATPADKKVFDTIAQMDAKTFTAFNVHDVDLLMSMFTADLEFYHDKGGLTNYEQSRDGFTKMFGNAPDIGRELIKGSLQVYPIKDFGAIEIGTHRFCHKENGKNGSPPRTDCGNFPFVMIWKQVGSQWQISRVISYGH